jgi:hypothetical protein
MIVSWKGPGLHCTYSCKPRGSGQRKENQYLVTKVTQEDSQLLLSEYASWQNKNQLTSELALLVCFSNIKDNS